MSDEVYVLKKSGVKDAAKEIDMRIGADTIDALNEKVISLIENAAKRTKGNGRKTIKEYDL